MSQQRKSPPTIASRDLDERDVRLAPKGEQPSHASGMFKDDPTFAEFRKILQQQRKEDYRKTQEALSVRIRQEGESHRCSSSTPTPSRTIKTRIRASARK